jgi:hypothetical protein
LAAEPQGCTLHQCGIFDGRGIDRNFIRTSIEQIAHVADRAHSAPDGERHEHLFGRPGHDVEYDLTLLV